jgi:hypothetical protein
MSESRFLNPGTTIDNDKDSTYSLEGSNSLEEPHMSHGTISAAPQHSDNAYASWNVEQSVELLPSQ